MLGLADNLGLLGGDIDYGHLGETALPYTDVSITVGGATFTQSADGLGYDYPTTTLGDAQIDARAELFAFIDRAKTLASTASQPYIPSEVLAFRDGVLPEEGLDPFEGQPRLWPNLTLPPPIEATGAASCVAITGQPATDLYAVLEQSHYRTPWLIGTEPPTQLTFRPVLPGDPGCARDAGD